MNIRNTVNKLTAVEQEMVKEQLNNLAPSFSSTEFFEKCEDLQDVLLGTDQPKLPGHKVDLARIILMAPQEGSDMREILMAN